MIRDQFEFERTFESANFVMNFRASRVRRLSRGERRSTRGTTTVEDKNTSEIEITEELKIGLKSV